MEHSVHPPNGGPTAPAGLAGAAFITLLGALFAFLALDDITTDNATTGFRPEFRLLGCVGAWLLFFVFQLWRNGRRVLAGLSVLLLCAGAWAAGDGIGHKNAGGWSVFWAEYSVILLAWLWFAATAIVLLAQAVRRAGDATVVRAPSRE
jgi:hypothetical protein